MAWNFFLSPTKTSLFVLCIVRRLFFDFKALILCVYHFDPHKEMSDVYGFGYTAIGSVYCCGGIKLYVSF
jgi:hypothetical protein